MPQENPYLLPIGDSNFIAIDASQLPQGFDTLSPELKEFVSRQLINEHLTVIENGEKPATFEDFAYPIAFLIVFALFILWLAKKIRNNPKLYDTLVLADGEPNPEYGSGWRQEAVSKPEYLSFEGSKLNYSVEEFNKILTKYCCYYKFLSQTEKDTFINRLDTFICKKSFFIHDESGYREMPVLISASAIQLSFGLNNYLLPAYPHIHIYPEEFLRTNPTICFLQGSVSGHSIFISWKHFMHGCDSAEDGQHVGLHEMAHAYHCQNSDPEKNEDHSFRTNLERFNEHGKPVFDHEQKPGNDLYTDYALTNFQEFWAESVEIYFEKPVEMRTTFPQLYTVISDLLNQDHAKRVENATALDFRK